MAGISVALSGGGHRASLFGLGALLYLVDAGKNGDVTSVASVSGGSLTNAFVAQQLNFNAASSDSFRREISPFVRQLADRGTLFAVGPTKAYVVLLGGVGVLTLGLPWAVPAPGWAKVALFLVGLVVFASLAQLRGVVCGRAFAQVLFSPNGRATRLSEITRDIDHVICATDLHAGEHVYFAGRFVCGYRFGWGVPGSLPLHVAVQASAALPGAFPPRWVATGEHQFRDPQEPRAASVRNLVLADGGVYDNMGDQWAQGTAARNARWARHNPSLEDPDELIVVNSSAALAFKPTSWMRVPLLGEIRALLRDKSILYDNGTAIRREALVARFDLAEREGAGIRGALVHIPQSPLRVARAFVSNKTWPERAVRARAVLTLLSQEDDEWDAIARANSSFKTTLSRVTAPVAARLLRHGYVLAMANLHVILGYPLVDVPPLEQFEALAT